jgi:hypothetical protein
VKLEEPPPGLLDSVLAVATAPAAAGARAEGEAPAGGARPARPPRRRHALAVASAAAVLALALLGVVALAALATARSGREEAARRARTLELELAAARAAARDHAARLGGDLRDAAAREEAAREEAARARADAAARERALAETGIRLGRLESEARGERSARARLEAELEEARGALAAARDEVAAAHGELALQRDESERLRDELEAARSVETGHPPPAPRVPAVVLASRGGRLELQLRGRREEVVEELFAAAHDEGSPDFAALALDALEHLLGPPAPETAPRPEAGGWWSQRLDAVAGTLGIEEALETEEDTALSGRSERARRLAALERRWREQRGAE